MTLGKKIRMKNLFRQETGRCVCIAVDHGAIAGPLEGIERPLEVARSVQAGGADCILTNRGFARAASEVWGRNTALILRLTGGFTVLGGRFEEELISTPEAALENGAAAAAITVKFGHTREADFIRQASLAADGCSRWGLPLIIEAMVAGKDLSPTDPYAVMVAARGAMEIGADIVKTCYTGDPDSFARVVGGCSLPVLVLGGEKTNNIHGFISDIFFALQAGAAGVAVGRNIWQATDVVKMVEAVAGLVHSSWSISRAMDHIS